MPTRPVQVIDLPCPACHAASGKLVSVATDGPGRFLFGYRCQNCQHEWQEHRQTTVEPFPAPDDRTA